MHTRLGDTNKIIFLKAQFHISMVFGQYFSLFKTANFENFSCYSRCVQILYKSPVTPVHVSIFLTPGE